MGYTPVRLKSARGQPKPSSRFERCCHACGASFIALAPGKTGEAGLWDDRYGLRWYCSAECAPEAVRAESSSYTVRAFRQ